MRGADRRNDGLFSYVRLDSRVPKDHPLRVIHRRGEGRVWSVVQPPTPEDEDWKRPHRERQNLLKERGRHVNRIKGLCAQQGILDYEPMRADRHERLAELETGDGRRLKPLLLAEIRREIARLEFLLAQIAELEMTRETAIKTASSDDTATVQSQQVRSLRRLLRLDKLSYDIHMVAEEMLQRGMIDVEAPGSVRVGSAAH
jgi:transposase